MKLSRPLLLACTCLGTTPAFAEEAPDDRQIIVQGEVLRSASATQTDTPAIEVPQPVTVVTDEIFQAQGAISVSDTLNYVAGVTANSYGPDSRVDGGFVRGVTPLQFRDGMRDIFGYYASIRADPYNFSQVEVVRGPASVLFGAGSLGGIVNLASKLPEFTPGGEVAIRYGSHDRKEALADITGPIGDTIAGRVVARVRDSGTQTDYVPDDRVMIAPSITWAPSMDTRLTLLGLYQEDDGGSTSQFLPLVGTILDNPNGTLPNDLFVGKPGWDRYDGRLLQGTALLEQRVTDNVRLNLKARYIDSDVTYFTHYPNSYSNPTNPYLDADQRLITLIASGGPARMEVFTTDNNVQFDFNTGANVEHVLLAGVDYSWNRVRKEAGYAYETIDIYDIDYGSLSDFGGGPPQPSGPSEDTEQEQLGLYLQDQIRFFDRVSLVLGIRHDDVSSDSFGTQAFVSSATTYRAGIIAEIVNGVSPFFSYTESFEPISGATSDGSPFTPKSGRQFEAGVKIHPNEATLLTLTWYDIKENGRPIPDNSTPDPDDRIQAGESFSRGFEVEGSTVLPGEIQLLANFSYNKAEIEGTGQQIDNVPKYNASAWAMKGFDLGGDTFLRLGGGVRYVGKNRSYGPAFPNGLVTPSFTLVDAMAEVTWDESWSLQINATNLLGKDYYAACLARGDCFMGAERNVFGTLSYRF
ncbi:iron complex outermembrane receptor protein [Altererythrobacter atlanticus]|uniref:Ferrichrome-iron receptor n=1 Tax=Croceibacterium atlanticum TaxID=1267766 RepID=A0A0F7KU51_9SPHN|nr:TonB-dependent siderophore receptor [Croceibacterium atlanticum]AKH42696.1 Ferrichrome-iron receptor precursor [Croceibacterium atlanticum]MBB5731473.1 iron complex outermembrane receptor protein [Croceibacterium atlanticum]